MKTPLITDSQSLAGAKSRFGHSIPVYDDGFGSLFIHRDSMGISGIVRAQTWEDAYGICEDEFFPEASETVDELRAEYGFRREHVKIVRDPVTGAERDVVPADYDLGGGRLPEGMFLRWETRETPDPEAWSENELFCEAYGFRPNGARAGTWPDGPRKGKPRDPLGHGIYAKDLNGDRLDALTPELLAELEITLDVREWEAD